MAITVEYFSTAGTAVNDGIFIPVSNLPGIEASELNGGNTNKESKIVFSLLNRIYDVISSLPSPALGFTMTKANPTGAGTDLINQNYSTSITYVANIQQGQVSLIPSPTVGENAGSGSLAITQVFPLALKLDAGDAVSEAGILIPADEISNYGGTSFNNLTVDTDSYSGLQPDNRSWIAPLILYLIENSTKRGTNTPSAVIAGNRGATNIFTPPAAFTSPTNPTSGISPNQLPSLAFFTISATTTIQLLLTQANQSFDVNSVAA